jgi:hypothetical protein
MCMCDEMINRSLLSHMEKTKVAHVNILKIIVFSIAFGLRTETPTSTRSVIILELCHTLWFGAVTEPQRSEQDPSIYGTLKQNCLIIKKTVQEL